MNDVITLFTQKEMAQMHAHSKLGRVANVYTLAPGSSALNAF